MEVVEISEDIGCSGDAKEKLKTLLVGELTVRKREGKEGGREAGRQRGTVIVYHRCSCCELSHFSHMQTSPTTHPPSRHPSLPSSTTAG
jgi:hypothetical protein